MYTIVFHPLTNFISDHIYMEKLEEKKKLFMRCKPVVEHLE